MLFDGTVGTDPPLRPGPRRVRTRVVPVPRRSYPTRAISCGKKRSTECPGSALLVPTAGSVLPALQPCRPRDRALERGAAGYVFAE
jgi:hypothetical protein